MYNYPVYGEQDRGIHWLLHPIHYNCCCFNLFATVVLDQTRQISEHWANHLQDYTALHVVVPSHTVPVDTQVLAALQFYSLGSFQWMLGCSVGLCQASVSRVITDALCKLANRTITFPLSQQAIINNKQAFSAIAGFPNVISAIDCTHVPIKSPTENEETFVNQKGRHTINIQAVCDANMLLLNLVAKWPVGTHDSFICQIKFKLI